MNLGTPLALGCGPNALTPVDTSLRVICGLLAEIRMVFSWPGSAGRSLSPPGNSRIARMSSPCWKTLTGGKGPCSLSGLKPTAARLSVERALQIQEDIQRVGAPNDHDAHPIRGDHEKPRKASRPSRAPDLVCHLALSRKECQRHPKFFFSYITEKMHVFAPLSNAPIFVLVRKNDRVGRR
jgi:hypothetical protein